MLRNFRVVPVVQMQRARHFYRDVLGLTEIGRAPDGKYLFSTGSGGVLALMEKPNGTPRAHHIGVVFEVESAEVMVQALSERGVVFEEYDLPGPRNRRPAVTARPSNVRWRPWNGAPFLPE